MSDIPDIIRALSDAGVSGWMFCLWGVLFIVGVGWMGKSLRGLKHNVADHLKSMGDKLAEH